MNWEKFKKEVAERFPELKIDENILAHIFASMLVIRDYDNNELKKAMDKLK